MSLTATGDPPPLLDRPPPLPTQRTVPLRTVALAAWLMLLLIPTLDLTAYALTIPLTIAFPVLAAYLFIHGRLASRIHAVLLTGLYLAYIYVPLPPYWWSP